MEPVMSSDRINRARWSRDQKARANAKFTADLAALAPLAPELEHVLSADSCRQEAMDGFARVAAGVDSPGEFFSDENVGRILGAAA